MKLEIERNWFAIWRGNKLWTAIALERWECPEPFKIAKEDGEYIIDCGHWRVFFTPPGYKIAPVKSAEARAKFDLAVENGEVTPTSG